MVTKEDLRNGMVVETRKGNRYCVCGGRFIGFEGWLNSVDFNDFLECEPLNISLEGKLLRDEFTIDKIYDEIQVLNDMKYEKSLKLLWEREVPKEMTVAEIEKELGYPIKIVKE